MNIDDLEKESGLSRKSIYLYEKNGLLNPEYKNGVQYYNKTDLFKLKKIKALRNMDYSLNAIKKILKKYIIFLKFRNITIPNI